MPCIDVLFEFKDTTLYGHIERSDILQSQPTLLATNRQFLGYLEREDVLEGAFQTHRRVLQSF